MDALLFEIESNKGSGGGHHSKPHGGAASHGSVSIETFHGYVLKGAFKLKQNKNKC